MDKEKVRKFLELESQKQGFDAFGIAHPDAIDRASLKYLDSLKKNYYGKMEFMRNTAYRRLSPRNLWPQVQSIVMLGMNYGPDEDPRAVTKEKDCGAISVYARHRDYHDVFKGRLKQFASKIISHTHCQVKVFVDTAPVQEKPLAVAAHLGWQGKHTNVVSRNFGSWLFLGSIFLDIELPFDHAMKNFCGSCNACLLSCPTDAFPKPYQLDARKCISYLTIELKDQIPREFRPKIGNRIYGCDECLAACPWNKFAKKSQEVKFQAREDLKRIGLNHLLELNDALFRSLFSGSAVKRIGRGRFVRNCLIAAGNSQNKAYIPKITALLTDENALVRGMALWALNALLPYEEWPDKIKKIQKNEKERLVLDEWLYIIKKSLKK